MLMIFLRLINIKDNDFFNIRNTINQYQRKNINN